MTPERAQYHLLMLRMGEYAEYDRELDRLLEEQDPLSDLVLELAFCMSDRRQTISVLHNFLLDHPADPAGLYRAQLDWLHAQCDSKAMSPAAMCQYMLFLMQQNDYADPWCELYSYVYEYELYDEGLISEAVFEKCFLSHFSQGVELDPWALQKEENQKKPRFRLFSRKS